MQKEGEFIVQPWRIVLGNDLEALAKELGSELFSASSRPFEKRIVVVPNSHFKDFLFQNFVSQPELQIAAGVQILPLNQAVMEILDGLGLANNRKRIPSFSELSLLIEERLEKLQEEFPTLFTYLKTDSFEKKQKRLSSLSDELARLFARYGLYGKQFLTSWLKHEGWQQTLWKNIFSEGSAWTYPLEVLGTVRPHSLHGKIALFGFSYLSPAHLSFFCSVPATIYHCSACALFWEDLVSDRERLSLNRFFLKRKGKQAVKEELNAYMQQGHPLLGNWGKLGREMLKSLDRFVLDEKEVYQDIAHESLLGRLKQSLLTLEPLDPAQADRSIQLHSATSRFREVEILRDTLETLLQEGLSRGEKICCKEILICCPDIAAYAPYIHTVFSGSPFAYCIEGLPLVCVSDAAKMFLELLQLPQKDYEVDSLLKIMHGFSSDEMHQLRKWFKQAHILKALTNSPNSWEEGIDRLLFGLAVVPDEETTLETWPIEAVAHSDIDLFNRFLEFFSGLREDLSSLASKKSAGQWFELFLHLSEKYCVIEWEKESFFQELKSLALSFRGSGENRFSFESIFRILEHLSQTPSGKIGSSQWDKVSFVPLSPGNVRSAKILGCLGLDEGAFPRSEGSRSLSEMHTDYLPLQGDVDRALFLDMILHAKDCLIFTYQRTHPEDRKHQGPSLLIDELDHYVHGLSKIDHPAFPFDKSYFSSDAPVKKWSEESYKAALACASMPQRAPHFFSSLPNRIPSQEEIVIDIRKLKKLARNPVQFYFNETLNMYLKDEEDEEDALFLISHRQKAILRKKALESSLDQVLHKRKAQGELPRGLFQAAATQELGEEMEDLCKALQYFEVKPDEISSTCLNPSILKVTLSDSRKVCIVGELEEVSPKGLIAHATGDLTSLVKVWPLYLIYRSLNPDNRYLLLTKKEAVLEIPLSDPHAALASYVEYFLLAKDRPSPLMPDWAKALLEEEEEDLEKAMAKETDDVYLQYLQRRGKIFEPKEVFSYWGPMFQRTFSPLLKEKKDAL